MSQVVHLKWGEEPLGGSYLMVTRQGRIRGEDFYVRPSGTVAVTAGEMAAFASLDSALRQAETEAERLGVETIYVRLA